MKKFFVMLLSVAMSVLCLCSLAACGGKSGVYKLDSITIGGADSSSTIKTGEFYMGTKLSEDLMTIELKSDGSCVLSSNGGTFGVSSQNGTWAENENDSNKIDLTVEGDTTTYYCDGSEFRFESPFITITLKKGFSLLN